MLSEFRKKHPAYDDMTDEQLAESLYAKFYPDMDKEEYLAKVLPQSLDSGGSTDETPESLSVPLLDEDKGQEEDQEVVVTVVGENGRQYKVKMLASEAKQRYVDQLMLENSYA